MPNGLFDKPTPDTGLYASVAPDRGVDHPDTFTYVVPAELSDLRVGERVTVPLGRGSRPVEGTVIALSGRCEVAKSRLKAVLGRNRRRLPQSLLDLGEWVSRYYCCPLGQVYASMVPAAVKRDTGRTTRTFYRRATLAAAEEGRKLPPKTAEAWRRLEERVADTRFPIERGELLSLLDLETAAPLTQLVKRGLLIVERLETVRASPLERQSAEFEDPTRDAPLTPEQDRAVRQIIGTVGGFAAHLLHGVTGSGKTEVYLRVLERVLEAGGCAIVLVPEISLTPQTAGRFMARFGGAADRTEESPGVAVLHSGLTASQRNQQWGRIASGRARVVVGARSAVFAPFEADESGSGGVGLIVVDEEHDGSYKQDQAPRYHARDVAIKRAQLEGCPVVLGSATPSLESYRNALSEAGGRPPRFNLIRLQKRVNETPMPRVRVLDLNEERRARRNDRQTLHALGPTLEAELAATLDADEQAILLLNRRGYAAYLACASPDCGFTLCCDYCDVHLVHHRHALPTAAGEHRAAYVKCHHCGAMNQLPATCPESGHKLALLGFGTQRLEEELAGKFPSLAEPGRMLRLDADTMHRAADYHDALERFRRGEARLLLGTQMIAKGLDFPHVTLVGVVNADTGLAIPDFRATERTFQLVSQVAGRAGRSRAASERARVVVQTMDPHHPAVTAAARHDYDGFAEAELAIRRSAQPPLPPEGRLARLVFRHRDHEKAAASGRATAAVLEAADVSGLFWRGPFDAPIARIAEQYRLVIELLAAGPTPIQVALTELRNRKAFKGGVAVAVDVDPVTLM